MMTVPAHKNTAMLPALLPNYRPLLKEGTLHCSSHGGAGGSSGESSTTPRSSDVERDAPWDRTAAFSYDTGSASRLGAPRHAVAEPSTVFQYFCLLCAYHGATTVPASWASLLAEAPPASQNCTGLAETVTPVEHTGKREAGDFYATVTTMDLTKYYVGPNTLLAFADLCRVHRVALARRLRPASASKAAVVVTAVAPLWNKSMAHAATNDTSKGAAASEEEEGACSLLPLLHTLRLVHLSLDFSSNDDNDTSSSPPPRRRLDGNAVLLYLLEALQGHPRLQLLDLSGNPIASALLPALSRLLQSTPSLTTLVLKDTLLSEDEKRMLAAQTLLNQLRLERGGGQPAAAAPTSTLTLLQTSWSAQTFSTVRNALEVGVTAVPWLLGKSTPYIRRFSVSAVTTAGVAGPATHSTRLRNSASCAMLDGAGAALHSALMSSFRSPTGVPYLCYDGEEVTAAREPEAHAAGAGAGAASSAPSAAPRAGTVWTPECVEVVRSAFLDRQVARQRVLGGRTVWPNVPLPEEVEESVTGARVAEGAEEKSNDSARPTVEVLSSSWFLKSVRQQLLPPPQAPPGVRYDTDTAFLTTAEENYWTVRQNQDKQWGYLVTRLAELLQPVRVHHDQVLYMEGESNSRYLYFLPPELVASQSYVELHAGDNNSNVNHVLPGQWVGEAEALGCLSLCSSAAGMMTSSATLLSSNSAVAAPPAPFARQSTARLITSATEGVIVWALPFNVAFFYLYVPYQQLQQQFMQRTPMSSFAHIHPVHLAVVPVQLESFHWTHNATTAAQRNADASAVLCTASYVARHIVLLQEGEYLLRVTPASAAVSGEVEEHHLLSGNAVVTQAVMHLDAAARVAQNSDEVHDSSPLGPAGGGGGRALGKEAALRQYRMCKAAVETAVQQQQRSGACSTAVDGVAQGTSEGDPLLGKEVVELLPYPSHAPVAHWRYAGLPNEAFAALCPPLRLALTRHCCMVPELMD